MSRRPSLSHLVLPLLVLAGSWFLTGCGSSVDQAVEQITEETHPIDPAGALSVRNALGSARIYGSDDFEVKVKATKKAWSTGQVSGIAVRVSGSPGFISVETIFPRQKTWFFSDRSGSVDYLITVPRTIRISRLEIGNGDISVEGMRGEMHAHLVNGEMTARNCFGNAELLVANGSLDLFYDRWEQRSFSIDARIISGNARAFLPSRRSFHVVAETINGNVTNHFTDAGEQNARRANKVSISIGPEISPDITIHASNGNIEIAATKAEPNN
jgi:hypothetical protein